MFRDILYELIVNGSKLTHEEFAKKAQFIENRVLNVKGT